MMRKFFYRGTIAALAIYLALLGYLFINQSDLLYHFSPQHAAVAAAKIPNLEELVLATQDGEHLVAWSVPPRGNKPVLLYFPGNAGNLGHPERVYAFKKLTANGTGLLAVSYRGYGGSTGHPTENGLNLDALALYNEGVKRYGMARLFAYGHSLGTGVAAKLAFEKKVQGLILEAPFTSAAAVAQSRYWYVPVSLLMQDRFRTDAIIGKISVPVLILHGEQDPVIPVSHGQKLFELARAPKRLVIFKTGKHDNLQHLGATEQIQEFVMDVQAKKLKSEETRRLP
jgi:alpha-beta hydrolase superfamily lysophospholipase